MPDIADTIPAESSMSAVLKTGLDVIDLSQTVTFTLYTKVVLPIDGFVFWVKTQLLSESAIVNASAFGGRDGFRISFAADEAKLTEAFARIQKALA